MAKSRKDVAGEALIQAIAEIARGLDVLDADLRVHARINTRRGKDELDATLTSIRALVQLQDSLVPIAFGPAS